MVDDINSYMGDDPYQPQDFIHSHQRFDNYQIYDIYKLDYQVRRIDNRWVLQMVNFGGTDTTGGQITSFQDYLTNFKLDGISSYFAYVFGVQRYSPSPPTLDLYVLINRYSNIVMPPFIIGRWGTDGRAANYEEQGLNNVIAIRYGGIDRPSGVYYHWYNMHVSDPIPPFPSFLDLAKGYVLDKRIKKDSISFIASKNETFTISYYRRNPLEPLPNFDSIDWHTYQITVIKGEKYHIDISYIVFGTLNISSEDAKAAIASSYLKEDKDVSKKVSLPSNTNNYPPDTYFINGDIAVMNEWVKLYQSAIDELVLVPLADESIFPERAGFNSAFKYQSYANPAVVFERIEVIPQSTKIIRLAANNNIWKNDFTEHSDINWTDTSRERFGFIVSKQTAYDWHIAPQLDKSVGTLIMDSPRTIEIHKALEAGKYALNELDTTKDRIPTLGHLLERVSSLLGYRPDANGKVDRVKEKEDWVRKQINKRDPSVLKSINDGDYSPACFATKGMMIKRLPNEIDRGRIVEGQIEKVHDIPQILASILDQLNESLGIQEGSNINIPLSNKGKAVYPNQLALLIDMARTLAEINEYTRSTRITAMVTHQQVGEILAATGLEPIAKFIEISSDGGTKAQIPYWGIHPKESLRTSIDNVTANVGILLGQIGV